MRSSGFCRGIRESIRSRACPRENGGTVPGGSCASCPGIPNPQTACPRENGGRLVHLPLPPTSIPYRTSASPALLCHITTDLFRGLLVRIPDGAEPAPVETGVVQATAAAQPDAPTFRHKLPDRPRRRRRPTVRWYGDPVPMRTPLSRPSSLGRASAWRTTVPAPGAPAQIPGFHLPLFEKPLYLPHTHHRPLSPQAKLIRFLHNFTPCLCTSHLGFGLGWVIRRVSDANYGRR